MKITKEQFEALPEALKAAFKADGSGSYDNGEEEVSGLKTALQKEKEEAAGLKTRLSTFEQEKAKAIEDARKTALAEAREKGDFKTVEDDYKRQIGELKKQLTEQETARVEGVKTAAIDKAAGELGKLFVSPAVGAKFVRDRLTVDVVDGEPIVRVLDAKGKPSAASVDDFKKELLTNPELKSILVASKGAGGGSGASPSGGGSGGGSTNPNFDASKASGKELAQYLREKGAVETPDE